MVITDIVWIGIPGGRITSIFFSIMYVFGKDVNLLERNGTEEKTVSLYIKFNKLENCFVIVISFHEQKYPLTYYFK